MKHGFAGIPNIDFELRLVIISVTLTLVISAIASWIFHGPFIEYLLSLTPLVLATIILGILMGYKAA